MAIRTIKTFEDNENYVFIPACCYNGNQFRVQKCSYPPMFRPEDASPDMPTTITDVPRLEPDGSGKIEISTGDAATPCIGVFSPKNKRGILVFTVQEIGGKNIGLAYENGDIRLTWPAKRELNYRMCRTIPNTEPWVDEPAEIPCKVLDFPCASLAEFYRVFFENRKIMELDCTRPAVLSPERQFEIQRNKFNTMSWNEKLQMYMVGTDGSRYQVWQPGWVGGGMSGYPLMMLGSELETERQIKTLEFLFSTQCESGFFHGVVDIEGNPFGDGFKTEGAESWHLLRKSADMLYFLFKNFRLMQARNSDIPAHFLAGTKKLADTFVTLWRRYGQFGQFADVHTGELTVGGSASASMAPAGLAEASRFFHEPEYLRVAEESAEYFRENYLSRGYTTGGPGEILQNVDSESAFGLLESYVVLYDVTRNEKWLRYAREAAHYCASWVVSYNYRFPESSEFARLNMRSVGCVFANLQNKHAAPGICTLSGDSLYKLWKWTGDALYLELLKDIAFTIGQYMSTDERPIYDWDLDPALHVTNDPAALDAHRLPAGFINERVNLSDWEDAIHIGGVFNGSCWSETSNLLTLAEVFPLLSEQEP
ncbi:MAG: hypothetical protein J6I98_01225 [Clostridia bacterium]|nr:hypothetical protein [Clostridia bacterium]